MEYLLPVILIALALLGHAALWVSFINRLNATPLHYLVLRWINRPALVICGVLAVALVVFALWMGWPTSSYQERAYSPPPRVMQLAAYYCLACLVMGVWAMLVWAYRRIMTYRWNKVRITEAQLIDVQAASPTSLASGRKAKLCAMLPGNQIFKLEVRTAELVLPNLPPALDGFSLVHLSDFHLAGHIDRPFFVEAVAQANNLQADMVAVTGDIIDKSVCLSWLEELGKLKCRHGVYFVLGNHDYRVCPPDELRSQLEALGWKNLGGTQQSFTHNGATVLLAGNELPWHREPPEVEDLSHRPDDANTLSIALCHTPDKIDWARECGFDLMLAGHLHGGQIRLPVIGPVLSPSRHGVRFSGGTFHLPPTVVHVSRGLSGMMPLRFNCLPEITKFVLRAEST